MDRPRVSALPRPPFLRLTPIALAIAAALPAPALAVPVAGAPIGGEIAVNDHTEGEQYGAQIAVLPTGGFVVVWAGAGAGDTSGIHGRRFDIVGTPTGPAFAVNTTVAGDQSTPAIAMDDEGEFVVVWRSDGQDAEYGAIIGRRFAADGTPISNEFQVNFTETGDQGAPDVAMEKDGDFVVAWTNAQPGYQSATVASRRFNRTVNPLGDEVILSGGTWASTPSIAMDADGDHVIAWVGDQLDATGGIHARRYDRTGAALGDAFLVNTYTDGVQGSPDVAMDADGDFIVTWQSYQQAGAYYEVYAQRYSRAGAPRGGEVRINPSITGSQAYPHVAMNSGGDYVVTWTSAIPGTVVEVEVWARRYTRAGQPLATAFRVNTRTDDLQQASVIGLDGSGGFVIAWESNLQDGDGSGLYAQRFAGYPTFAATMPDFDGNGVPEIAGLSWTGTAWIAQVRDAYTGVVHGSTTFSAGADPIDFAVAGGVTPQLVVLGQTTTGAHARLERRTLAGASQIVTYADGNRPLLLESLPDLNGNASGELASLTLRTDTGAITAQVRDGTNLALVATLAFDRNYLPIDLAAIPDVDGNGKTELAVLGQHLTLGSVRVETRDAFTAALVNTTFFNPDVFPYRLAAVPDLNGNGKPELAVFGVDDLHQITFGQVLDAATDRIVRLVSFGNYAPITGIAVLPDQSGNGKAELAVLQPNLALDRPVVEIRDAASAALLRTVPFSDVLIGRELLLIDDFDGSGAPELGVQAVRRDTGADRLQMRDSESGALIRTAPLP